MTSEEIIQYYSDTTNRDVREDLVFAERLIGREKIAVDCGCGAGADIAFLRDKGFTVHAFDIEEESIRLCRERFGNDENIHLSCASFNSFDYPQSTLLVADASLFFCPADEFVKVWSSIFTSLVKGGIFCGSFLGPNDTMAGPDFDKKSFWEHVLVFNEVELRVCLGDFEILKITEHNVVGEGPQGSPHQWHIYSVVARKI